MAQTITNKRSSNPGKVPLSSDLELGELAVNTYDGKLFLKQNDGSESIVEFSGGAGGGVIVSAEPPPEATGSKILWCNLTDGCIYIDVSDGDSNQWVSVQGNGQQVDWLPRAGQLGPIPDIVEPVWPTTVNMRLFLTVTPTGPGETWILTGAPTGVTIDNFGLMNIAVSAVDSFTTVGVQVVNDGGSSLLRLFDLYIGDPTAPLLEDILFIVTNVSSLPYEHDMSQHLVEGSNVIYTLTGQPTGVTINSSTGLMTVSDSALQGITQGISLEVVNSFGSDSKIFTLQIKGGNVVISDNFNRETLVDPLGVPGVDGFPHGWRTIYLPAHQQPIYPWVISNTQWTNAITYMGWGSVGLPWISRNGNFVDESRDWELSFKQLRPNASVHTSSGMIVAVTDGDEIISDPLANPSAVSLWVIPSYVALIVDGVQVWTNGAPGDVEATFTLTVKPSNGTVRVVMAGATITRDSGNINVDYSVGGRLTISGITDGTLLNPGLTNTFVLDDVLLEYL